jgi:hypothetical protein
VIIAASPRSAGGSSTITGGLLAFAGRTDGALDESQDFLDSARSWLTATAELKHKRWISHRITTEPSGAEPAFAKVFFDV